MENFAPVLVNDLSVAYREKPVLWDIDLELPAGKLVAVIGPNGAGKTTSIKMLLGLVAPTSGKANLLGAPIGDRATLARIGFLPEHFRFQDWMTASEFLVLNGELLGMEGQALKKRRDELLERVGLAPFRNKQLRTFSKGMLQRIGLAQALLNHPALVFLDEPTSGLDPVGRRLVRDVVHELRNEGTCVFLNSHLLSEIEVTCDRVAFIRHGEVVRVLELATLNGDQSVVTIRASGLTSELVAKLTHWGSEIQFNNEQLTLTVHNEASIPEINRFLVAQGVNVFAISPSRISLEEIFIETVGKDGGL